MVLAREYGAGRAEKEESNASDETQEQILGNGISSKIQKANTIDSNTLKGTENREAEAGEKGKEQARFS